MFGAIRLKDLSARLSLYDFCASPYLSVSIQDSPHSRFSISRLYLGFMFGVDRHTMSEDQFASGDNPK